jgi:excisionase family DNA binding protein
MTHKGDHLENDETRQHRARERRLTTSETLVALPPEGSPERLLDVQQAAALLGLKPATLYQWAYRRRLPVVKLFGPRGALRFRLHDVQKLIQDSLRPAMKSTGSSRD